MSQAPAPERLPLTTPDLAAERLARLRELLPGAIVEGKVVTERLAELVGAAQVSTSAERYGLSYAGRGDAVREMLAPSNGTLRPDRDASENWDATENLIIEGDNLHVLKLLQSAYAGSVKLIYIDPPYNTGNDFVYPDDFRQGVAHYKEQTQQTLTTNPETSGRYHSDWLKMMHPRLALARNLLKDDGVIFVSIDDHEVHNLRLLMDEVFGEENFVGQILWRARNFADARPQRGLSVDHEYMVVYGRSEQSRISGKQRDEGKYANPDADPRGPWTSCSLLGKATADQRPNLHYRVTHPETGEIFDSPAETGWICRPETFQQKITEKRILWPKRAGGRPREKVFLNELKSGTLGFPSLVDGIFTSDGTVEMRSLFDSQIFPFPKPSLLLKEVLEQGAGTNDLVLDFFAGSGTTAHAVLELNKQDGSNRKFILVQYPEPTGRSDAFKTIADITRERVRRVIRKLTTEDTESTETEQKELALDKPSASSGVKSVPGFRAYRLDDSNFKLWDGTHVPRDGAALGQQLEMLADNVRDDRSDDDLLAEIILKCGHPGVTLGSPVQIRTIAGQAVHLLANGSLAICLGRALTPEILRGIIAAGPTRVLCLDCGFAGNDELKTNTVLEMQSHGIRFQTV
jgi:adenine-specific DNA-methyltransferase